MTRLVGTASKGSACVLLFGSLACGSSFTSGGPGEDGGGHPGDGGSDTIMAADTSGPDVASDEGNGLHDAPDKDTSSVGDGSGTQFVCGAIKGGCKPDAEFCLHDLSGFKCDAVPSYCKASGTTAMQCECLVNAVEAGGSIEDKSCTCSNEGPGEFALDCMALKPP